ncbi:MAG: hypothetical protein JWQ44_2760, partial [Chthoniobacter sp.]|nr:hypothetical protein [Chthoniobacter sp.]
MNPHCRIEPLEARIAPATFLVSASSLVVTDSLGVSAQNLPNESSAQIAAGSDAAVLLATGDKLVFDANNNHTIDVSDSLLVQVIQGQAMVFVTDRDGDLAFDRNEVSGLAVSDLFVGALKTDIDGDIVTALDAVGNFTSVGGNLTIQPGTIGGITSTGAVNGAIVSGGSMTNIKLGKPLFGPATLPSVGELFTGDAGAGESFRFGDLGLNATFTQAAGIEAGSISAVTLARGANSIETGTGGAAPLGGMGGSGGAIFGVTILDSFGDLELVAGAGGDGSTAAGATGAGGVGGAVSLIKITSKIQDGSIRIDAGDGGRGARSGDGGAGGALSLVTLTLPQMDGSVTANAGSGGDGGQTQGAGGAGGTLTGINLKSTTVIDDAINLGGGAGGDGNGTGAGGAGGAVSKLTLALGLTDSTITIAGGAGGNQDNGPGGAGGALSGVSFTSTIAVEGNLTAQGGAGGSFVGSAGGIGG